MNSSKKVSQGEVHEPVRALAKQNWTPARVSGNIVVGEVRSTARAHHSMTTTPHFDPNQSPYLRFRSIYAERTKKVVPWVGAGLSSPAGLPTWPRLRERLQEELKQKAKTLDEAGARDLLRRLSGIESISDFWIAFEQLRPALGHATYQAAVRQAFKNAAVAPAPRPYHQLWAARVRGILTLNIDRFTGKAFSTEHHTSALNEMSGKDVGPRLHVLGSDAPFVVNLHGVLEDASTWVFTKSELDRLLASEAYKTFLRAVFATHVVLFIGISADDIAAGGFLRELTSVGADAGEHFWLTDRRDLKTDKWAEEAGIQIIRYDSSAGHEERLNEFFSDLRAFTSPEIVAPPVIAPLPLALGPVSLPPPAELAAQQPESIRTTLSGYAATVLADGSDAAYDKYHNFCRDYTRAIHNAWFVSQNPPDNILFGYRLEEPIGNGAFGKVYAATSPSGDPVAIKLLRQEVQDQIEMLGSFRRGVRSMKILSQHGVMGMVPYKEAYELPACVVMERISGPNLQEAAGTGLLSPWDDSLRIATEIATIIRTAHMLPERVLHRDIRPPNIMLKNFYGESGEWSVVVLDFDLSWHKGATERSVLDISAGTALGYLAPEQLARTPGASTRSTAVDSFGLAMTLYFLYSGGHPAAGQALSKDWPSLVEKALARIPCKTWRSAPARLARLIVRATDRDQVKRLDMTQFYNELIRIREAVQTPEVVESAELWAEELLALGEVTEYSWDHDSLSARLETATGWIVRVEGKEVPGKVELHSSWSAQGDRERRAVAKYLPKAAEKAEAILKQGGWTLQTRASASQTLAVTASVSVGALRGGASRAPLCQRE